MKTKIKIDSIETSIKPVNFIKVGKKDTGNVLITERSEFKHIVDKLEMNDLRKRCTSGFIIIIALDDGSTEGARGASGSERFELNDRFYNPCLGGHLRRYGPTHTNCTRPQDDMPTDLHNPFPNGNPVGLIYRLGNLNTSRAKACFSNDSPWVTGFGGEEFVEISSDHLWIKTGAFDCTVFVNLLKAVQQAPQTYDRCIKAGLSVTEALTFSMFFNAGSYVMNLSQNTYSFDPRNSIRRMIEKRPVNLTGGTFDQQGKLLSLGSGLWSDCFDYNRPDMACVFRPDKSIDESERSEKVYNLAKAYSALPVKSFEECLRIFNEAKEFVG